MIVLGLVERPGLDDLACRSASSNFASTFFFDASASFRSSSLWYEDRGAVLVAVVAELLVLHGRIDVAPEIIEQLWRSRPCAGRRPPRPTRRGRCRRPRPADRSDWRPCRRCSPRWFRDHARHVVEIALDAPEAAAREGRDRALRRRRCAVAAPAMAAASDQAEQQAAHAYLPNIDLAAMTYTFPARRTIQLAITRAITLVRPAKSPCRPALACLGCGAKR